MQNDGPLTFFTYAMKVELGKERWTDRVMPGIFFEDADEARRKVLEVRDAMREDPEMEWRKPALRRS